MVARRVGTFQSVTCAAPGYLAERPAPHSIEDLQTHHAVHYFSSRTGRTIDWDFVVDGVAREVKMNGRLAVNDVDAYVACALQGFGLVQAPLYMVAEHIDAGRLVEILAQWKPTPLPISVVYLHNRHLSPKVRAFVDWVAGLFITCPLHRACTMGMPASEIECHFVPQAEATTVRAVMGQHNIAESIF